MSINLFILAIAPTITYLIWIYLKDKYDREPVKELSKFFTLGVLVSVIAIMFEWVLLKFDYIKGYTNIIYLSFIVAGLTEEILKAVVLIPNLLRERNFNEELDGVVYSVFLSLGFATVENIIYIILEDKNMAFQIGLTRAVVSIPAHIIFATIMGYYVSKYKFSNKEIKKREYIVLAVLTPTLVHGFFDFLLMIQSKYFIIIFILYMMILIKISLDIIDEYIRKSKKRFKLRKTKDKKID